MAMQLLRFDAARRALADLVSVDEVKDWRDKSLAIQAYARQAKDKDLEIHAAENRFRAERRLGELLGDKRAQAREMRAGRLDWIARARAQFNPGPREPCAVCGKYMSLSHAHHVAPLSLQFKYGTSQPDHTHVWLCPTHHSAVHSLIDQANMPDVVHEMASDELTSVLKISDMRFQILCPKLLSA